MCSKHFCGVEKPRKTKEQDFRCFACKKKWGKSQEKERGGWGRGRRETLADKPLDLENPVCQ